MHDSSKAKTASIVKPEPRNEQLLDQKDASSKQSDQTPARAAPKVAVTKSEPPVERTMVKRSPPSKVSHQESAKAGPPSISSNGQGEHATEERKVAIAAISFDESLQVRANQNPRVVAEYAELMKEGERFPPVQLFRENDQLFIGDGWHRLLAARLLGYTSFPAIINIGGRKAALKFALSANSCHGLPRTNEDKLRALAMASAEYLNLSNRELARICAVSEAFVRSQRDRCARNAPERRIGADGKTYAAVKAQRGVTDEATRQALSGSKVKRACSIIDTLDGPPLLLIKEAVEKRLKSVCEPKAAPLVCSAPAVEEHALKG